MVELVNKDLVGHLRANDRDNPGKDPHGSKIVKQEVNRTYGRLRNNIRDICPVRRLSCACALNPIQPRWSSHRYIVHATGQIFTCARVFTGTISRVEAAGLRLLTGEE